MMKLFFAIIESVVLALIAWYIFDADVRKYQTLGVLDTTVLGQSYFSEKGQKDGRQEPKYASLENATAQAERDITTGKKLLKLEATKIRTARIAITVGAAIAGFLAWFSTFFIVYITTRPLASTFDSIWGNFVRFFLVPSIGSTIFGVIAIAAISQILIQKL